jgi:hypothetical protein
MTYSSLLWLSSVLVFSTVIGGCASLQSERNDSAQQELITNAGLYPPRDLSKRSAILPVPGLVFDLVVEPSKVHSRNDLIFVHRNGEYLQKFAQSSARAFEPGEKLDGLGFHPNTLARLPGSQSEFIVNAEGIQSLISIGVNQEGRLDELARVPHRPSFSTTPFLSNEYGLSLAVTPYERGFVDLLLGFDPVSGTVAQKKVVELALDDVAGQSLVSDLDQDGTPELLVPTRRSRKIWKIANSDGEPKVEVAWSFDEGAPRMVLEANLDPNEKVFLVPLDGAGKIAFIAARKEAEGVKFSQRGVMEFPSRFGPGRIALGYEYDGSLVFVADGDNELILYRLAPDAPLEEIRAYRISLGVGAQHFSIADVDGDGALDLVMSLNRRADSIAILYGPLERLVGDLGSGLHAERVFPEISSSNRFPVARVAGRVLTREEITGLMVMGGAGHLLETPKGRQRALDIAVEEALLDEVAYREGLDRIQIEQKYFPLPAEPEEAIARQYYLEKYETFGLPERVHLYQMQFRDDFGDGGREAARARADKALQRLRAGEDFRALAAELTENPRAREKGGNVGFVSRNADLWLKNTLEGLRVGERTDVVESTVGYEILLIVDQREPIVQPYEEIAEAVKFAWRKQKQNAQRKRFLEALEQNLTVERISESNQK